MSHVEFVTVGVGAHGVSHSWGLPLLVRDLVQRDGANVTGANVADVCEGQERRDPCQAHTSALQIHVSQVHAF